MRCDYACRLGCGGNHTPTQKGIRARDPMSNDSDRPKDLSFSAGPLWLIRTDPPGAAPQAITLDDRVSMLNRILRSVPCVVPPGARVSMIGPHKVEAPSIPKRRALEWSERGRARQMRPAEVTKEEWECLLSETTECHGPWHGNRATHAAARLAEYREWGSVGDWVLSGHGRMLLEALRERRKPKPKPRLPVGMLPPRRGR